jgi:hypothetical protein
MANENRSAAGGRGGMVYVIAEGLSTVGKRHLDAGTVVTVDDFEKKRDFDELIERGVIIQKSAASVEDKKTGPETKPDVPAS